MRYIVTVRNGNIITPLRFLTMKQTAEMVKSKNRAQYLNNLDKGKFTVSSELRGLEEKIKIERT